ncbi:MAG: PilZ domain-containing protein [Thermoanaerobaculales bacterium]
MTTDRERDAPDHDGNSAKDLVEIDLDFKTLRRFQAEFAPNLSHDGLFVETGEPLPPSTVVRFRVLLPDEFVLVEGTAIVVWTREPGAIPGFLPGMALRFATLGPQSQELIDKIVDTHIATGGVPFEIEPQLGDELIPSDAIAGGETPKDPDGEKKNPPGLEGFKLTIRTAGDPIPASPPVQEPLFAADAAEPGDPAGMDELEESQPESVLPDWIATPAEGESEASAESVPDDRVETLSEPELVVQAATPAEELPAPPPADLPEPPPSDAVPEIGSEPAATPPGAATEILPIETLSEEIPPAEPEPPILDIPEPTEPTEPTVAAAEILPIETLSQELPPVEPVPPVVAQAESAGEETEILQTETILPEGRPAEPEPPVLDIPKLELPEAPRVETAGGEFEVSLFAPDETADDTPFHPDAAAAAEVTVMPKIESARRRSGRNGLLPLIATVVVAVIAVASWFVLRPGEPRGSAPAPTPVVSEVEEALQKLAEATPIVEVVGKDGEASEEQDLETPPAAEVAPPQPTPEPTPQPTPSPQFGPANRVVDVSAVGLDEGTRVTIRGNGDFDPGTILIAPMTGPPRVLVRIRWIESRYELLQIDVGTPDVLQIRTGHHPEQNPPSLFVVLDLADDQVALGPTEVSGDTIIVNVGRY